jgi:hypothetical protein
MSENDKIKNILSVYIDRFVNIKYKDEDMFRTVKVLRVFDDRIRALENGIDKTFLFNRIKTIIDPEINTPFENTGFIPDLIVPRKEKQVKSREIVIPRNIESKVGQILSNYIGRNLQIKYKDEDMFRNVKVIHVTFDKLIALDNDIEKGFLINRIRVIYDPETNSEYHNENFTLDIKPTIRSRPKESKRYLTKSREQKKPKGASRDKLKPKRRTLLSRDDQPLIKEVKMSSRRYVEEPSLSLEEFERERKLQQRLAAKQYKEEMKDVLGSFGNIGIQEDDEDELAGLMGRSLFVNKTQRNPFEMRIKKNNKRRSNRSNRRSIKSKRSNRRR